MKKIIKLSIAWLLVILGLILWFIFACISYISEIVHIWSERFLIKIGKIATISQILAEEARKKIAKGERIYE